nr:hypothetical protein [Candidatus Sigynarchaeota archaeon]
MTLQACSAWLRDHRARQRFEAVECVLDDDTTEVSQGSAVPARSIPMVPRPPEKDSPVQDPTMQQIELFDPDSGETYMARIIGPSSATECKVPKKGADQPNDDYITIDLARYPVTIDDNCTIAVHDDPIVIEQSDP